MKKERKKLKDVITKNHLCIAEGLFLVLFAIMGAVNYTPFAQFFTYCLSFFVGTIISYVVYAIIFLFGVSLMAGKKVRFKMSFLIAGLILITLGVMIIFTNSTYSYTNSYLTFSGVQIDGSTVSHLTRNGVETINDFGNAFKESFAKFPQIDYGKNVGIIGLTLTCIINSTMSNIGSYCFGAFFITLGTVFVLLKLVIRFSRYLKGYIGELKIKEKNQKYKNAKDIEIDDKEVKVVEERTIENTNNDDELNINKASDDTKDNSNETVSLSRDENLYSQKTEEDEVLESTPINNNTNQFIYNNVSPSSNSNGLSEAKFDDSMLQEEEFNIAAPSKEEKEQEIFNEETIDDDVSLNASSEPIVKEETTYEEPIYDDGDTLKEKSEPTEEEFSLPTLEENKPQKQTGLIYEEEIKDDEPTKNENVFMASESLNNAATNKAKETEIKKETDKKDEEKVVDPRIKYKNYQFPPAYLLSDNKDIASEESNRNIAIQRMDVINNFCVKFGIKAKVIDFTIGPSVTQYDLQPEGNYSVSGFAKYLEDLSRELGGIKVRFSAIVPGKTTSGIEIQNVKSTIVYFKDVFTHLPPLDSKKYNGMFVPFGKDISGNYVNLNFQKLPHLLVCGTTGSGKSVFMHSVLMSMIMRSSPEYFKLLIIDPKQVEFPKYRNIPHLLCPVITEANEAYNALTKVVKMMDERYTILSECDLSDLKEYNEEYAPQHDKPKIPYVLVVIDEYADIVGENKNISAPVQRLAQKARAAGIHIILTTQAPRSDIINGVIKSNFSARVALLCSNGVDSQNIIDTYGAEKLLGNGDMLIKSPLLVKHNGMARVQSSLIEKDEIKEVLNFIRSRYSTDYDPRFMQVEDDSKDEIIEMDQDERRAAHDEELYSKIKEYVCSMEYCSISKIQRTFGVGFNKAGKLFDQLINEGIVEDNRGENSSKGSKVLKRYSSSLPKDNPGTGEQSDINYSIKD